jgi:TPR repeat protein
VFVDYVYSAELLARDAELGYAPSAYVLGECSEYGKMECPQHPALSIHHDNIAGQQNDRDACFALTALCLVSSPCVLPRSDTEGILVSETRGGRGTHEGHVSRWVLLRRRDWDSTQPEEAIAMFQKAADLGDTMAEVSSCRRCIWWEESAGERMYLRVFPFNLPKSFATTTNNDILSHNWIFVFHSCFRIIPFQVNFTAKCFTGVHSDTMPDPWPDPVIGHDPDFGQFECLAHLLFNHYQIKYTPSSTMSEHAPGVFGIIMLLSRKKNRSFTQFRVGV